MEEVTSKVTKGQMVYCGIDVHKHSWKIAILKNGQIVKVFSQQPNIGQLVAHLRQNQPAGASVLLEQVS